MSPDHYRRHVLALQAATRHWHERKPLDASSLTACDLTRVAGLEEAISQTVNLMSTSISLIHELERKLLEAQREHSAWRDMHRRLATLLGATSRGRDHCDAELVILALKRAFDIVKLAVAPDATEIQISTRSGTPGVEREVLLRVRVNADLVAELDGALDERRSPHAAEVPCDREAALRHAIALVPGERHAMLKSIASALRFAGAGEQEILVALRNANQMHCRPPKTDEELQRLATWATWATWAMQQLESSLSPQESEPRIPIKPLINSEDLPNDPANEETTP